MIITKPSLILIYLPFNLGWHENFHSRKNEAGWRVHFVVYINEEGLRIKLGAGSGQPSCEDKVSFQYSHCPKSKSECASIEMFESETKCTTTDTLVGPLTLMERVFHTWWRSLSPQLLLFFFILLSLFPPSCQSFLTDNREDNLYEIGSFQDIRRAGLLLLSLFPAKEALVDYPEENQFHDNHPLCCPTIRNLRTVLTWCSGKL